MRRDNGSGSIFYSKSEKRYIAEIVISGGKKKRKRVKTHRAAREWIAEALQPTNIQGKEISFKKLTDLYIENTAKPTLKYSTLVMYQRVLSAHVIPNFGNTNISSITSFSIQQLLTEKLNTGLSNQTVKHIYAMIKRVLNQAVKWGYLGVNPIQNVTPPKVHKKEVKTFTREETAVFLAGVQGTRYTHIYTLAITTGMRQGELLGIRWQDVDFESRRISINQAVATIQGKNYISTPKTGKRVIKLSQMAVDSFPAPRMKSGLVLCTRNGNPVLARNLLRHFKKTCVNLKLPNLRFHDLRHTAATLLLSANVHPKIVQEMLGHSTIALTLDTYSHVIPSMQDKAADTMDNIFK